MILVQYTYKIYGENNLLVPRVCMNHDFEALDITHNHAKHANKPKLFLAFDYRNYHGFY